MQSGFSFGVTERSGRSATQGLYNIVNTLATRRRAKARDKAPQTQLTLHNETDGPYEERKAAPPVAEAAAWSSNEAQSSDSFS